MQLLSFQSQNLVVDYISFKFKELDNTTKKQIANYLLNIGFNSYQKSGKLAKPIKEPILVSSKNQFEVRFVGDNYYWSGTSLHFSGSNAARFYFFSKEQIIDWTIFSAGVLSRFDIYYSRQNKKDDKILNQDFLHECLKQIQQTNTNVGFDKNSKG